MHAPDLAAPRSQPNSLSAGTISEAQIASLLQSEIATALDISAEDVDPGKPFMAMGMDSLMAMELRNRIQAALGSPIPVTQFFIHPTVDTLSRGLLDLWRSNRATPARRHAAIERVPRLGGLPLSYAQEQIWFLHELMPVSAAYNIGVQIRIRGPLDPGMLEASFKLIVARHEALRTTFRSEMGVPEARVAGSVRVPMPIHDVGEEAEVLAWGRRDAGMPFDIGKGPLFRIRLLRHSATHHVLILTMHHIIADGWSFGVVLYELRGFYQAFYRGMPAPLPELDIQYADYAAWQRRWLSEEVVGPLVAFWQRDLAGAPPLELPTDGPVHQMPTFRGARIHFEFGQVRSTALRAFCGREDLTLFVPLMAAFAALLQRYSGQDDLVIGTVTASRVRIEVQTLIGLFVNALPVRLDLSGDPDIRALLTRVQQRLLEVMAHEELPFEHIVNATGGSRDGTRNPLFQVQLILQGMSTNLQLPDLTLEVEEIDTGTAKRDLTVTFFNNDRLSGHVEYATDRFAAARIERLIRHFQSVIDAFVAMPLGRVAELAILTEADQSLDAMRICPPRSQARTLQELFEETVDRTPDSMAVIAGSATLTYRQLDQTANQVARWLHAQGVRPSQAVALRLGRTIDLPAGILGIVKAGAVYVPIDPAYPQDRADFIRNETGAVLMIETIDAADIASQSTARLACAAEPDDLAYVIYTSGSTGTPKGVMVSHGSVVEYADTLGRELGIVAGDRYLHTASISFSSSIRQFFVPLAAGASVVLADFAECRDPTALLERIQASAVSVLDLVPTMVRLLVDTITGTPGDERVAKLSKIRPRLLLTASEPLRARLVEDWRSCFGQGTTWINMYGQTETTGIVSLHPVPPGIADGQGIVPIGRPRGNVAMLVLDRDLRPLPSGIPGQLYIGGTALAQGYTDGAAVTASRFHADPMGSRRLYASGDLVRRGWDGTLTFLGRLDQQIKIRGLRIEPGEIEEVLLTHPLVGEAAVKAIDDGDREAHLVAYVTSKGAPISHAALRAHVLRKLPAHMLPARFVILQHLPVTPTGKLDRRALPAPDPGPLEDVGHVPPRAGVEAELAAIWQDVLKIDRVGAEDNFFLLGGHSLMAVRVRSLIESHYNVGLPLAAIFEDQTLAALALRIEAGAASAPRHELPPLRRREGHGLVPASYAQEQFWQLEQACPGAPAHWNDISVCIEGPLDPTNLVRSLRAAVQRHALLRTVFHQADGMVWQSVLKDVALDIRVLDDLDGSVDQDACEGCDLPVAPPLRAELRRDRDNVHILRLLVHRILCDGQSMRQLFSEIVALYLGLHADLPEPAIGYGDYAAWERAWLSGTTLANQIEFHLGKLQTAGPEFSLRPDHPRHARGLRHAGRLAFELPPATSGAAEALAMRESASLHMVLLAAFAAVIAEHNGQPVATIAAIVSRRSHRDTEQLLGPFMNTVPLPIDVPTGVGLPALVRGVKATLLGALAHQDAPFHLVIAALTAALGPAAAQAGQVAMVMADPAGDEFALGDITLRRVATSMPTSYRDLTLSILAAPGEIRGTLTFDRDLFDETTMLHILQRFTACLAAAAEDKP